MAKRIEDLSTGQTPPTTPPKSGGDGDGGLSELSPNSTIDVAGKSVTVRHYGFFEGLEVLDKAPGFMAAFKLLANKGEVTYARIRTLFGKHRAEVAAMVAQSTGQSVDWVDSLDPDDGEYLLATWFVVHCSFFVKEAVMESQELLAREVANLSASIGLISSQHLPPPASETSKHLEGSLSRN